MLRKVLFILLVIGSLSLAACSVATPIAPTIPVAGLANPASVYCGQNGGRLDLRQDSSGGVTGVCVFPDGSQCEEWAYFRKECKPGDSLSAKPTVQSLPITLPLVDKNGWKIYRNDKLGLRFSYPADAVLGVNDEPLKSISVTGPLVKNEYWPTFSISFPGDREDFRPPDGTDLLKWLTDHNMVGDKRMPDVQIAGTTAIHLRFDRSPQSYAYDRYYFAKAGQLYMIVIGHTGDKEDWQIYNQFLASFGFDK